MRRSRFSRPSLPEASAQRQAVDRRRVGRTRVPLHRRLLIARSALMYWVAVVLLCLVTGTVVSRLVGRASAAERRYGPTRVALVTTRTLRTGERVTAAVTRLEQRPATQLPATALTAIPRGGSVSGPVARGEVLTDARLQSRSGRGRAGTAAMAVPRGEAPLPLQPGDRVDVYATYDPTLAPPGATPTSRVADHAEVVRAGRTSVTVLVRQSEVRALATAVARATIIMALER